VQALALYGQLPLDPKTGRKLGVTALAAELNMTKSYLLTQIDGDFGSDFGGVCVEFAWS
jgi:hypothetical protein